MKNILFLFLFVFSASIVSAQTCTKAKKASDKASCAKTCASKKSASLTKVASAVMTADLAAEADESIEKRVCSKSGAESFYQTYTCSETGKVSHKEVEYDADTQTFVNVKSAMKESTPVKIAPAKEACGTTCAKDCCKAKDGKVKSAVKTATAKKCAKTCKKTCASKKAAVEQ